MIEKASNSNIKCHKILEYFIPYFSSLIAEPALVTKELEELKASKPNDKVVEVVLTAEPLLKDTKLLGAEQTKAVRSKGKKTKKIETETPLLAEEKKKRRVAS